MAKFKFFIFFVVPQRIEIQGVQDNWLKAFDSSIYKDSRKK